MLWSHVSRQNYYCEMTRGRGKTRITVISQEEEEEEEEEEATTRNINEDIPFYG